MDIAVNGKIMGVRCCREGCRWLGAPCGMGLFGSPVSAGQSPAGTPVTASKRETACRFECGWYRGRMPFVPFIGDGGFIFLAKTNCT